MISRGKLSLKEELLDDESSKEVEGEISTGKVDKNAVCNIIHELIRGEWDTISNMEMYLQPLVEGGADDECIESIKEVLDDEYMHVGVYENLLMKINPNAELIDDGRVELENKESEGEDAEEEDEDDDDEDDDDDDDNGGNEDEDDESLTESVDPKLQQARDLKDSIMKLFRSNECPEVVDCIKEAFKMAGGSCRCKLGTGILGSYAYVDGSVPVPNGRPYTIGKTIRVDYVGDMYDDLSYLAEDLAAAYYKSIGGELEGYGLIQALSESKNVNESTELTEASRNLEEIEKEYEEAYGKELDWDSVPVVSFTDKFLSGWGEAENKNWRQVILCGTSVEAANIEDNIRRKPNEIGASRVNRSFGRKYNPSKESYSVAANSPVFLPSSQLNKNLNNESAQVKKSDKPLKEDLRDKDGDTDDTIVTYFVEVEVGDGFDSPEPDKYADDYGFEVEYVGKTHGDKYGNDEADYISQWRITGPKADVEGFITDYSLEFVSERVD